MKAASTPKTSAMPTKTGSFTEWGVKEFLSSASNYFIRSRLCQIAITLKVRVMAKKIQQLLCTVCEEHPAIQAQAAPVRSAFLIAVKMVCKLEPIDTRVSITITETRAAIKPYSIIVTPFCDLTGKNLFIEAIKAFSISVMMTNNLFAIVFLLMIN
jgi:hypothetical protein